MLEFTGIAAPYSITMRVFYAGLLRGVKEPLARAWLTADPVGQLIIWKTRPQRVLSNMWVTFSTTCLAQLPNPVSMY